MFYAESNIKCKLKKKVQIELIIDIICNWIAFWSKFHCWHEKFDLQMNVLRFVGIYLANRRQLRIEIHSSQITQTHWLKGKQQQQQKNGRKKSTKQNANGIYLWFIWINNYNGEFYWHKIKT